MLNSLEVNEFEESLEKSLLLKIIEGQFDNKNSKKGRKKNYDDFFEKTYLNKYVEQVPSSGSNIQSTKKIQKVTVFSPVYDS